MRTHAEHRRLDGVAEGTPRAGMRDAGSIKVMDRVGEAEIPVVERMIVRETDEPDIACAQDVDRFGRCLEAKCLPSAVPRQVGLGDGALQVGNDGVGCAQDGQRVAPEGFRRARRPDHRAYTTTQHQIADKCEPE
jgi:hypothetical protein